MFTAQIFLLPKNQIIKEMKNEEFEVIWFLILLLIIVTKILSSLGLFSLKL